jgi:hypothetical protein
VWDNARSPTVGEIMRPTIPCLALLAVVASSTAAAGPAVVTKWRLTGEARNDCMGHAMESIKRAGFKQAEPGSQSMSGRMDDYTVSIRCVTEQQMVFFVVAGPSPSEANRLLEAVYRMF